MSKTVLQIPITHGNVTITEVEVRKPTAGELRGMKLFLLLQMDVAALIMLLPRITAPALSADDVAGLDPADFMSMANEVVSFFMTPAARAEAMSQTAH